MPPLRGIQNTARTLSYYTKLQALTSNNIANASTEGFKVDKMAAHWAGGVAVPVPVQGTDLSQGALRPTGRPLDLALEGDGFFVVQTDAGDRFTRGGSLKLDRDGWWTDLNGQPLLGVDGPILVRGAEVQVEQDGTVLVDGVMTGRLRVETVDDPATLLKEGNTMYVATTPTQPVTERVTVRQGAIDEANVDAVMEMVDLVQIQRAYAANVDALKAMDSVLGTVSGDLGRVR